MNTKLKELLARANTHYEYETEHADAANCYTTITDSHAEHYHGIDHPADRVYFGNWYQLPKNDDDDLNETEWLTEDGVVQSWKNNGTLYVTVYLGQEELEFDFSAVGIDTELTAEEVEWINRNTDWVCNDGTALYQAFPETWVVAEYAAEKQIYIVVVGNLGVMYSGTSLREALATYHEYVRLSKEGYGKAAGESVTMFTANEITHEYSPG